MPIEYTCEKCRQSVRTPDAAAGKKGKCPHCGAVMVIPGVKSEAVPSPAPPAEPKKLPPADSLAPTPTAKWRGEKPAAPKAVPQKPRQHPAADAPIEFPCPQCQGVVRTPQAAGGKKGKCPHCQAIVRIPMPASAAPEGRASIPAKSVHAPTESTPLPAPRAQVISPKIATPDSTEPNIGASYPLGTGLVPSEKPRQLTSPESNPLDKLAPRGPTVDSAGLTPLEEPSGLVPLPDSAGLTPLPGVEGLTPLDPAVSGLTPLAETADPFADAYALAASAPVVAPLRTARTDADIRMMVMVPAIFQMIATLPTILYILIQGAFTALALLAAVQLPAEASARLPIILGTILTLFGFLVWIGAVLFVIKGSIDLMHRQSYVSALSASILNILLCTCGIGFPIGLWSLIVLCFAEVRQTFRS